MSQQFGALNHVSEIWNNTCQNARTPPLALYLSAAPQLPGNQWDARILLR
jgi:hypothetical protein